MARTLTHIKIGNRLIGEGQPTYIIAEVGINHNGNPEVARQLIDVAAEAGADAVKFQKRDLRLLYSREVLADLTTGEKELQFVIPFLEQAQLSDEVFTDLAAYARRQSLEFLCTPWDETSVDFLESLDVAAYKVASADLTNLFLLDYMAQKDKPLIVSTGMSRWEEIECTAQFLHERQVEFALLHCQSTYPAPFKDVNLKFMERLRTLGVPVGYSGHERGIAVSTVAAAFGACIVERHITLDRAMRGPDHAASLEPQGLGKQVRDIRAMETALGDTKRSLSRGEILNRHALRKSLAAARDIAAGEVLTEDMLQALGPGSGISPQRHRELIGRTMRRDIRQGQQFRESDLKDITSQQMATEFPRRWGPVVRYRDAAKLAQWNPDVLEFHLTDQDLDNPPDDLPQFSQELIIHAPEYYHGQLMDLCTERENVRESSLEIIAKTCQTARKLLTYFSNQPGPVKIVVHPGGMSYDEPLADTTALLDNLACSTEELRQQPDVEILLENHPPLPWYFGGQWYSNVFVKAEEIAEFCQTHGGRITFDLSHAQLWCNYAGEDIIDYIRTVKPWIAHLHLADSSGTDGEALQVGEGETDFAAVMAELADVDAAIIPEIWLGHREEGEGFLIALEGLAQALGTSE